MITLKKYVRENRALLNANPCTLIARPQPFTDHYFRVAITVNGSEVIEESHAKVNGEVIIDLMHFYKGRFPRQAPRYTLNTIQRVPEALIEVSVTVNEYLLLDNSLRDTATFPTFKILQAYNPFKFDDLLPFVFLGNQPLRVNVDEESKVTACFFYNEDITLGATLSYSLYNEDGDLLLQKTTNNPRTGIYIAQVYLTSLDLTKRNFLRFGDEFSQFGEIEIIYRPERFFARNTLYYQNNHGLYMYADLFGESQISYPHEREEYLRNDNTYQTFESTTSAIIKINTGHLYGDQLPVIKNINVSREVFLYYEGEYRKARLLSKKSPGKTDGQFLYDDTLEFEIMEAEPRANDDKFVTLQ